jgi:hypothetical protein
MVLWSAVAETGRLGWMVANGAERSKKRVEVAFPYRETRRVLKTSASVSPRRRKEMARVIQTA